MSNNVSENLQSMFSKMENFISTKTVVGETMQFGDTIIVPLVEITFGSASGMADSAEEKKGGTQGGGGIGAKLSPVAVIVIVNGTAQLIDVKNKDSVNKLIDLIPGVISKLDLSSIFSKKDKNKKENEDEDESGKHSFA